MCGINIVRFMCVVMFVDEVDVFCKGCVCCCVRMGWVYMEVMELMG